MRERGEEGKEKRERGEPKNRPTDQFDPWLLTEMARKLENQLYRLQENFKVHNWRLSPIQKAYFQTSCDLAQKILLALEESLSFDNSAQNIQTGLQEPCLGHLVDDGVISYKGVENVRDRRDGERT